MSKIPQLFNIIYFNRLPNCWDVFGVKDKEEAAPAPKKKIQQIHASVFYYPSTVDRLKGPPNQTGLLNINE